MKRTRHRYKHGRVGVRRHIESLTPGRFAKLLRRRETNPWVQEPPALVPAELVRKRARDRAQRERYAERRRLRTERRLADTAVGSDSVTLIDVAPVDTAEGFVPEEVLSAVIDEAGVTPGDFDTSVSTKEAAEIIGMSPGFVKDHARALGGEKHGLRWSFDVVELKRSFAAMGDDHA